LSKLIYIKILNIILFNILVNNYIKKLVGESTMEFHEKLRVVAGILCLVVAALRVVQFFFDLGGAIVYSALFVP
jgi:hypothetical protein